MSLRNLAMLGLLPLGPFAWFLATKPADLTDAERVEAIAEMYAGYRGEFADVPEVRAQELLAHPREVVFVDVRSPEEQAISMLPGAVDFEHFKATRERYREQQIVTYCTIGYRSGLFAKDLQAEGFHASNLVGGVLSWTHADGPLVHQADATKSVHVYGPKWNLAKSDYTAVW